MNKNIMWVSMLLDSLVCGFCLGLSLEYILYHESFIWGIIFGTITGYFFGGANYWKDELRKVYD